MPHTALPRALSTDSVGTRSNPSIRTRPIRNAPAGVLALRARLSPESHEDSSGHPSRAVGLTKRNRPRDLERPINPGGQARGLPSASDGRQKQHKNDEQHGAKQDAVFLQIGERPQDDCQRGRYVAQGDGHEEQGTDRQDRAA